MAKLINILAASIGGGLVLGASIRLGEAIGESARNANQRAPEPAPDSLPDSLKERLERLEQRVPRASDPQSAPEWKSALSGVVARMDRQHAEVEAIRKQMSNTTRAFDSAGAAAESLRDDLHRQLSEDLNQRLMAVEEKLRLRMETAHRETVNAMVASIETSVAPRISRLESDMTNQSAAMAELRECSLESERSIQRLLAVLERVMSQKAGLAETAQPANAADLHKLTVVTGREPEEPGSPARAADPAATALAGSARRPASFR